ncbi:AbrB/MazE/SpoVT family DNA-binding domain-containing protein [Desulfosporosinus lacus]|uniref:Looped-hinge helix DNA binding domain-containing protein, AbrB family n=1 Tax=Desulfosporosinus lacus DSM 15449 TaxID=1121420 RepID=A0A1M6E8W2_9FIRM|nr:AbrB/MazE/SpoVT family DNA-binding domain-containing protein [Desulfosporosinus lacus]SHI81926.1 looped-hinge helix DNA binding domain-containing protein, AbrB family [Desulfosporosinus lacus DSM 15449]
MMHHGKFYGSTVMGERGQVVIPAEAREEIGILPGEKLIVLGNKRRGVVILFKSDVMTRFADMMFRKTKFFEELFNCSDGDSDQDKTKR